MKRNRWLAWLLAGAMVLGTAGPAAASEENVPEEAYAAEAGAAEETVDAAVEYALEEPAPTGDNGSDPVSEAPASGEYAVSSDETGDTDETVSADEELIDSDAELAEEYELVEEVAGAAEGSGYVLMNIPYAKFYEAETGDAVDAVTSATLNKPRTGTLAGGSYHVDPAGTDISGVIYPVYVEDLTVLAGYPEITEESSVTITTRNRGQTQETTYTGQDALFESADYSWYRLDEAPSYYKVLSGSEGNFSFGAVCGSVSRVGGVTGSVTYNARHADIEISLSGTKWIAQGDPVAGIIVTTDDGQEYPLRHIVNIWRTTEIGWNYEDNDIYGKTITNIRYITREAVIDYPVDIPVQNSGYVLMNIPYAKFYEAETENAVDAVSSATKNKPRTGTLAGGSYHVDPEGTDISGVIYPVYVEDVRNLAGYPQITDDSTVSITVTNRGNTVTTEYAGADALFESADYSYYVLSEKPAYYKVMSGSSGNFSFSAVKGSVSTVNGVTGSVTYDARHADIEIKLSGTKGIAQGDKVSGVVVTTDDGQTCGLRHVANLWRAVEIGWDYEENDIYGKTITNLRYITTDAVIDYPVEIVVNNKIPVDAMPKGAKKVVLEGLPEDAEDVEVTVALIDPETGETTKVLAEKAVPADGAVELTDFMEDGARYAVTVTGSNYRYEDASLYYEAPAVSYASHLANKGWEKSAVSNGAVSGTTGQSRRMEAIRITAFDSFLEGSIEYKSHLQNKGWEKSAVSNGAVSGTTGQSRRMEAVEIRLTGELAEYYDVYYQAHCQNKGWLGWAKNGEPAGTEGMALRMEAVRIMIVPKGAEAPGSTAGASLKK